MWTLRTVQNNYDDGVIVGYGVSKGNSFAGSSSFTGGNVVIMIPFLDPLNFVDLSVTPIWPFAQCAAVFIASGDSKAWVYQYSSNGGLTCTINADGSPSFVGDNGVIVPLAPGPWEQDGAPASPFIAATPVFLDGTTVMGTNGPEQYVTFGGAKFWIPSPAVAASLKLDLTKTTVMPQDDLSAIPVIPTDGTLLKELSSDPVYLIQESKKAHLLSSASVDAHGGWGNVKIVPDGALNIIPAGADIS